MRIKANVVPTQSTNLTHKLPSASSKSSVLDDWVEGMTNLIKLDIWDPKKTRNTSVKFLMVPFNFQVIRNFVNHTMQWISLLDFWPIRSQCTTKDSEPSIPDFSKDLHAVNRDQNQSAAPANIIFIDCDGSEYWSCKSAYEDIFYPFHAHVQNSDDGRTTFSLHNNNGNADSCKIRKQSHIQQTRLGRCISKLATWCKNGLLKNL